MSIPELGQPLTIMNQPAGQSSQEASCLASRVHYKMQPLFFGSLSLAHSRWPLSGSSQPGPVRRERWAAHQLPGIAEMEAEAEAEALVGGRGRNHTAQLKLLSSFEF